MTSYHAGLDINLPMTRTPYATLLTQAEHDSLERFNFFPTFNQENPSIHDIEIHSVSEWINLNAQCTISNDVANVTWDAFSIPEGCNQNEQWEIIVSVRDESQICSRTFVRDRICKRKAM